MRRLLLTLLFAAILATPDASASEYVGELCWRTANQVTMTLGISEVGGRHLSIDGTADNSLPGEVTVIDGSATVRNHKIFMTLHFTGEDNERVFAGSGRAVIDLATMDGEFQFLELGHPKASPDPREANASYSPKAPLTSVPCE